MFPTHEIDIDHGKIYELTVDIGGAAFTIKKSYTIVLPKTEYAFEFSDEEYELIGSPKDVELYKFYEWKYFRVRLYPLDVSFSGVYLWEIGDFGALTGVFSDENYIPSIETIHMPAAPLQVNDINETCDEASLKLSRDLYITILNYYLANENSLVREEVYIDDVPANQTILGKIVWHCPIRWSISDPGTDNRSAEQCIAESIVKNQMLAFDGVIFSRRQEMILHYTTYPADPPSSNVLPIGVDIIKTFGIAE